MWPRSSSMPNRRRHAAYRVVARCNLRAHMVACRLRFRLGVYAPERQISPQLPDAGADPQTGRETTEIVCASLGVALSQATPIRRLICKLRSGRRARTRTPSCCCPSNMKWLEKLSGKIAPKSKLGRVISYTLNQRDYLVRYTSDGRVPIDHNIFERDIRPFCTGRKS